MHYFVTAIDTDSGKTLASAILCEALQADYWKPVQAGLPRDSETVQSLISNSKTKIQPERYLLKTPASPHASAKIDGVKIALSDFQIPQTKNNLVIEGAGGCLVPLNDNDFVVDLIAGFRAEVVLVADLYLGSINHTLLTLEALKSRRAKIKGIIFNGDSNPESERIILEHHKDVRKLLHIKKEMAIDRPLVQKYAIILKENWNA
jgi:dethiobiotin synthetase